MFSKKLLQVLFVALAFWLAHAVQANERDDLVQRDPQPQGVGDLLSSVLPGGGSDSSDKTAEPTQPAETTSVDEPTSVPSKEPDSSTSAPPDEPTTSDAPPSETTSEPPADSTSGPDQPSSTKQDAPSTTSVSEPTSSSKDDDDTSSKNPKTTAKPIISTEVQVITRTNKDGSKETETSSSVHTIAPSVQPEGDNNGGGGLTPNTRNIVIGVVVGVGGAILLGVLGVVAWRIRARKKAGEASDSFGEYNSGYTPVDKAEPMGSVSGTVRTTTTGMSGPSARQTPFESTLDTYHQPTGQVNASSNF